MKLLNMHWALTTLLILVAVAGGIIVAEKYFEKTGGAVAPTS